MTAKIFIVEDDETIVTLLKHHLSPNYQVASVQNFRSVSQEVLAFDPDVILMDISLPYFNGFYWTTEIRKSLTVPILFISSANDEMNAIMAMNMGGDDFIAKPFSLNLLDAKIAAFLRRVQQFTAPRQISFQEYELSLDGLLTKDQASLQLSPTEAKILATLFLAAGQVVTKEQLLDKLWEGGDFIDSNTLSVNMTRLRKKVAQLDFHGIHTVRGVGYLVK